MAITIQDLLASDTISQAVDKINFNFDQLLLNGGGPVGPPGPLGPSGPIGGRGERGSEWYEGTDNPNVTPPGPGIIPLQYDKYLRDDGQVWEYTGLTWFDTGINLTGQTGPQGSAVGWGQFGNDGSGNYVAVNDNVSYPSLFSAPDEFVTTENQGVPVASFGIASPSDSNPGILNNKFQITSALAGALDSSLLSVLIRQGDAGSSAIKFMGGGLTPSSHYEQNNLDNLSSISLGTDDTFTVSVPKLGTAGDSNQYTGYIVDVAQRGHQYRAGNGMLFETGTKGALGLAGDNSNVTFTLAGLTGSTVPTFTVNTLGAALSQTKSTFGPGIGILATNPVYTGGVRFDVDTFGVAANSNINLLSDDSITLTVNPNNIGLSTNSAFISTTVNPIDITTLGGGNINIATNEALAVAGNINIDSNASGQINITSENQANIIVADPGTLGFGSIIVSKTEMQLLASGTGNSGVNLKINSNFSGQKIQLGLGAVNSDGAIEIGRPFTTPADYRTNAGITLNYTNTTSPGVQDDLISITGRVAFLLQGTASGTPHTTATIYVDTGTTYYPTGSTIKLNGDPNAFLNPGVIQEVWHDYNNSSVIVGKGFTSTSGNPTKQHGIFFNDDESFPQYGTYNPAGEKFKVDANMTKVSNRMIWGGKNGMAGFTNNTTENGIELDLFSGVSPFNDIEVASPFLRIVVGPMQLISYNYANYANGTIYDPSQTGTIGVNDFFFNLLPPPPTWASGQRLHVELLAVTGQIIVEGGTPPTSNPLSGNPNIGLRHVQRQQGTSQISKYSRYIETGAMDPSLISSLPRYHRVNYTLQWSGFRRNYFSGNFTTGPVNSYAWTPGWSLIAPPVFTEGAMDGGGSNGTSMYTYFGPQTTTNKYPLISP